MENRLLKSRELDTLLRYPSGRSARLARQGKLPHIILPDGEIRFDPERVREFLNTHRVEPAEVAHG